jgi:hypothetical protein
MKKLLIATALLSLSTMSFGTALHSMNKTQVMSFLGNKTITTVPLTTLNSTLIRNSFTGFFNQNGTMSGQFERNPGNGGPKKDRGHWMVKSDGLTCITWQHWDKGQEKCMTMYQLSNSLLVVGPSHNFETMILNNNVKSGNRT